MPFLAHNPIVNALRVFLLDSPGVYAIDSESISPFVVLKGDLLERLARSNLINRIEKAKHRNMKTISYKNSYARKLDLWN